MVHTPSIPTPTSPCHSPSHSHHLHPSRWTTTFYQPFSSTPTKHISFPYRCATWMFTPFTWIIHGIRTIITTCLLCAIVMEALIRHIIQEWTWSIFHPRHLHPASIVSHLTSLWLMLTTRLPTYNIYDHIICEGYQYTRHTVTTRDGFILTLQRIRSPYYHGPSKGPILMQHGLFNTALVFVLNGAGRSLAMVLADAGYDVWLGNNRGNIHSRRHQTLQPHQDEFWSWGIDELVHDIESFYQYILSTPTPRDTTSDATSSIPTCNPHKLIFIGHSQGSTQAFSALAIHPHLHERTSLMIAIAPAVFIQQLHCRWLQWLCNMYVYHPILYYILVGTRSFIPLMEHSKYMIPPLIWSRAGELMFHFLFEWSARGWDPIRRPLYFQETPSTVSTRNLAHWLQHAQTGDFCRYHSRYDEISTTHDISSSKRHHHHANGNGNNDPTQTSLQGEYDLTQVTCPVALVYGGKDRLLNIPKLKSKLKNVIYDICIPEYYHMDALAARDAHERLYPSLLELMNQYQ